MGDDRAVDLVALARELERHDIDVATRLDVVVGLLRRVDELRARAHRLRAGLAAIPGEMTQVEQAERDAQVREARARHELAEAERRLEEVARSRRAGEETRSAAERAVRRAVVGAADAAATVARIRDRRGDLAGEEVGLRAEAEGLAVEARDVARAVADVPRLSHSGRAGPGGSLDEIEEWGARAHAGLFVVRDGLENERERIVLEANTLAAAALGDHAGGTSVALVRKRLEESLSGR
jgi:chromosome segregation ATPase